MSQTRAPWLKWLLLVALIAAIALGAIRTLNKRKVQQQAAQNAALALQAAAVFDLASSDIVLVQSLELAQIIAVSGSLKAVQTALVKAKVAGEISGLNKREGDTVRAGEELGRIDNTEALARVRQAEQQASAAEAQVVISRRTQDNNQALVKQGFISATALDTSSASLAAAEANHQASLATRDIARKSLADTTLRAPISGQVSARAVQNGERVGVDAKVYELIDLSGFELEAALAPADAVPVHPGQTARLNVEGLATPIEATVARINPSVQPGSRSVLVYLKVPTVAGMRQGLFAQGQISTGQLTGLALPLSSVRNDKPAPYVQAVRDGKVVHVTVGLESQGQQDGEPMLLVDGAGSELAAGTLVLRVQAGAMREGTAVRLPDAASAAQTPATAN